MLRRSWSFPLAFALLFLAPGAHGQPGFPFQLRVQQGPNVLTVANSATLVLGADAVGQPVSVKITVLYQGATSAVFSARPQLLGSADFSFTPIEGLPLTLAPNDSFNFEITFRPASSRLALAQLGLGYVETPATRDAPAVAGFIFLNLTGAAPEFSLSYALFADGNVFPLTSGSALRFQPTPINTTATATIIISNRGSGPGTVNSASLAGAAFQLLGLPLLPATLPPATELRFGLRYAPRQIGTDTGSLQVSAGERSFSASIEGSGIGSAFSYELIQDSTGVPLVPNQVLSLADTAVGERTSVTVRVRNTGNADGPVNLIGVSGPAFGLADLPFFPLLLAPNEFLTFTLSFVPAQPGRATGRLRIGNDIFELAATGIGARLVYSYASGSTTNTVLAGGAVLFSPLQAGRTARLEFTVRNAGTSAATIASIGVGDPRGVFRLEDLPSLPARLEPEASVGFSIVFAPDTAGLLTAPLAVDAQTFILSGFGDPPPALPAYRFTGPSGNVAPLDQPAIGLSLQAPYVLPLRGTLTMTVEAEGFSADPAVQFSTGGRTVAFTIPANSTQARFANGASEIRLQAGTTAGTITLTPTFSTQTGLDLTPQSPESLRLTIPQAPPRLLTLQVLSRTPNSFTLGISGLSTTRSLTRLEFQFKTAEGARVSGTQVTVNVDSEAGAWYRSPQGQSFGGQFLVTISFNLRVEGGGVPTPVEKIQSVSTRAANERGVSNAVSTEIR